MRESYVRISGKLSHTLNPQLLLPCSLLSSFPPLYFCEITPKATERYPLIWRLYSEVLLRFSCVTSLKENLHKQVIKLLYFKTKCRSVKIWQINFWFFFIDSETEHGHPFELPFLQMLSTYLKKGQLVCLLIINRWQ